MSGNDSRQGASGILLSLLRTPLTTCKRVGGMAVVLVALLFPSAASSQKPLETKPPHSPSHALMLSAVLPGAGQVYNKQVWKVPLIYAAIGGISYYTYDNLKMMRYYRDEYLYRVANGDQTQYPNDPDMVATPTSNIYNLYEAYNKTFQLSVIISVAVYGINLLDAYVFGHLFEFQINDDISLNMTPSLLPSSTVTGLASTNFVPAASFTLHF
ncbi:MAG: hypothetical protein IJP80_02575 [Bacteroidales bacterium]|nr:hypothetical protein [Bacteroidales bacterium]